jgi:hypothetical protein
MIKLLKKLSFQHYFISGVAMLTAQTSEQTINGNLKGRSSKEFSMEPLKGTPS